MKNEPLYKKTVDILVQAYFNDTLRHGHPCGCAVGNIIAANIGVTVIDNGTRWSDGCNNPAWLAASTYGRPYPEYYKGEAKSMIDASGYSLTHIALIEKAFEGSRDYEMGKDENMFNGLMSVIEALDIIHENTDAEVTTQSKLKFQHA